MSGAGGGPRGLLERLLETAARAVEEPAVIVAAEPAVLLHAVTEIRTPVRAVAVQEPVASVGVPVQHEVLAHDAHGPRRVLLELAQRGDRLPVAPHQLAHRRAAADARETLVVLPAQHQAPLPRAIRA